MKPHTYVSLNLDDQTIWLSERDIWYGQANKKYINEATNDRETKAFMQLARQAFLKAAQHMQQTLPLCSPVLQVLQNLS